jgi:hypothetical protein
MVALASLRGCASLLLNLSPDYPHNSRPRPANAAALLRHEDATTSAAGAFDTDSSGSDATAE